MSDCFNELGFEDSGKVACHVLQKGCCSKEYYQQMLKENKFEPSGTDGQPIYNVTAFKHGFTTAIKTTDDEKALDYIAEYINKGVRVFGLHSRRFWYSKNLNLPKEYKQKYHTNFDIATDIRDVARNVLARNYGIISYNALGVKTKCVIDMGDLGKYMKVRILAKIKPEKPIEKIKVESKRYSKRVMQEIAQAKLSYLRQVQGELVFD